MYTRKCRRSTVTLLMPPDSFLVFSGSLFPSFSSCLRSFFVTWKLGKFFLVLCQCLFKISQSCVSPRPPSFPAALTSRLCVSANRSGRSSGLCAVRLLKNPTCPVVPVSYCVSSLSPWSSRVSHPRKWRPGMLFFCQLCPLPRLEKRAPV